jgi:hypothetical protein
VVRHRASGICARQRICHLQRADGEFHRSFIEFFSRYEPVCSHLAESSIKNHTS